MGEGDRHWGMREGRESEGVRWEGCNEAKKWTEG